MKTVFINLSLRPGAKRRHLPVGLACIMTATQKAGFAFDLIDMDIDDLSLADLTSILEKKLYDVYAMGCIVTGFKLVRELTEVIKKINPEALVVAGNSVATSVPDLLLRHTMVDIAVLGEGDVTFVELLKKLADNEPFRSVPGIAYRHQGQTHFSKPRPVIASLDGLDFPDWRLFDLEKYNKFADINSNIFSEGIERGYPLNTARGCPYNCTFCYHCFKGEKYRSYSARATFEEIKRLHYQFGATSIMFWDELTFSSIKDVTAMIEQLTNLDFSIKWEASARAGLFKREHIDIIRAMNDVGCNVISYSLENASPKILKAMKKKITVEQFIEQSMALKKGGVIPLTSVIFGYPQETRESIQQTLDVCEKCEMFPSVGFLLPLPGTPIYDWARNSGHIPDEVAYLERIGDRQDFHINLTAMSDEELVGTVTEKLTELANRQGLHLDSVFKTTTYQKPSENS